MRNFRPDFCLHLVVTALFAAFVFHAGAGFASADPHPRLAEFAGDWRLLDTEGGRVSRMTAIDRAIGDLSWVVRKMAAPILRRTTAPPPRMQFTWDGRRLEQLVVRSEGKEEARPVELDAEVVEDTDSRGEPMTVSWQWTGSGLRVNWAQNQAYGHNLYRVDSDSETLVVKHTIQVTGISDVNPIIYESRFGRRGLPAVSAGLDSID
jgi:hypothetical protein